MKKPDFIEAGRVYDTNGRKGPLTVRIQETFDYAEDGFFKAEILIGKARYLSQSNRAEQRAFGLGTPGDVIHMRTTLTTLVKRRHDLESEAPAKTEASPS